MIKFIFSIILFSLPIFSQVMVEKISIEGFPKIRIDVRESGKKSISLIKGLKIYEVKNGYTRNVENIDVIRSTSLRPVKLILSVQASTYEKNKDTASIARSVIESLEPNDGLTLMTYGNETIDTFQNISRKAAIDKVLSLPQGNNKQFQMMLNSIASLEEDIRPEFILILSPDKPSGNFKTIEQILKKIRARGVGVHISGAEDKALAAIAAISGGSFYPSSDKLFLTKIQTDFFSIRKPVYHLEYTTPFLEWDDFFGEEITKAYLGIGNKKYQISYEVNLSSVLKSRLGNVEFFYSITVGVLLICILILFSLTKNSELRRREELQKKQKEILKADIYYQENTNYDTDKKVALVNFKSNLRDEENEDELESEPGSITQSFFDEVVDEKVPDRYERVFIILKEGPHPGRQFSVNKEEIIIGSSPSSDLILLDKTISATHAKIKKISGDYYIYDLASSRGIFVNGKKILKPRQLNDFDEIRLGRALLIFRGRE
ncbi:MAG: FHA domain-containing protein [Leptospiraceae bacterium]|nr:FHA domain-containing protein [Leptospiraceae bacterium]